MQLLRFTFLVPALRFAQLPHHVVRPLPLVSGEIIENRVTALDLKRSEVIADTGAGTGYFARRFAMHAGKVYAVDIETAARRHRKRLAESPPSLLTRPAEDRLRVTPARRAE